MSNTATNTVTPLGAPFLRTTHIINSSASAPPNATKMAVKKVSDVDVCMFGPEL